MNNPAGPIHWCRMYKVKEIFYTLQGEGHHSGRPAVFCRFTGCNLWSGQERHRSTAICQFCDTDFVGGDTFNQTSLANKINDTWKGKGNKFVVFTGGEPALQLDENLVKEVKDYGFTTAVETNGTRPLPSNIDWITVSPKARTQIIITQGNEVKVVYPQTGIDPKDFQLMDFEHFYIQPMDGFMRSNNTSKAIEYCLKNTLWKLSTQVHKRVGIR